MPQDVFFNLYEYFNVKGQCIDAMVVMDSDDPDFDADSSDPAIEEQLISVVENNRWGRQTNDAPTLVPDSQAVNGLTALVGAVMQESVWTRLAQ